MAWEREKIITDVFAELKRAEAKFPGFPVDPLHALAVLQEEVGEVQKAVLQSVYEPEKSSPGDIYDEGVQVAAMALRFLFSMGQYQYIPCKQTEKPPET